MPIDQVVCLSNGLFGPPGQTIFSPPGLILNPGNASPPGQQETPPGQQKKAAAISGGDGKMIASDDGSDLVPVTFLTATMPLRRFGRAIETLSLKSGTIIHDGSANVAMTHRGVLYLQSGEMLLAVSKNITLRSGRAPVNILPGTVCLMQREGGITVVRTVYDTSSCGTLVTIAGKSVFVSAGQEAVIDAAGHTDGWRAGNLGHRRVKEMLLETGVVVAHSEISLTGLMQTSRILSCLRNSEDPKHRRLARKVMKMAACLAIATVGHGEFIGAH